MNVFISHSQNDEPLAQQLTDALVSEGFSVLGDFRHILPGDNWASKIAEALQKSNAMIALLTPDSLGSTTVQSEISYALGERAYTGRLIPVLAKSASVDQIPWILRNFKIVRLGEQEEEGFKRVAEVLRNAA